MNSEDQGGLYGFQYYENGSQSGISGYNNYRWMPELTLVAAHSILRFCSLYNVSSVFDYGCAKGFLVKAFRMLNVPAFGIDISSYAIKNCDETVVDNIFLMKKNSPWDELIDSIYSKEIPSITSQNSLITFKDVLEHIHQDDLPNVISDSARKFGYCWASIPLGTDNTSNKFIIEDYHNDITHITIKDSSWWVNLFAENGFKVSLSTYRCQGLKDNWYRVNSKGNLFIYAESTVCG